MHLYIFFFVEFVFQLFNTSFMSPIWTLYHESGFFQPDYKNTLSTFLNEKYTAWKKKKKKKEKNLQVWRFFKHLF